MLKWGKNKKLLTLTLLIMFVISVGLSFQTVILTKTAYADDSKYPSFVARSPLKAGTDVIMTSAYNTIRSGLSANPHNGVDLVKSGDTNGVPVYAVADGTVVASAKGCNTGDDACGGGFGNHVMISHGNYTVRDVAEDFGKGKPSSGEVVTVVGHMQNGSVKVKNGDKIKAGTQLGAIGNTGFSRGSHLHLGVYLNNNGNFYEKHYNPMAYAGIPKKAWNKQGVNFKVEDGFFDNTGKKVGKASGTTEASEGKTGDSDVKDSEEWKKPLVEFIEREFKDSKVGLADDEHGMFINNNLILGFTNVANTALTISYLAVTFLCVAYIVYLTTITIFYLVLLPKGRANNKASDIFEKTTGIDAVYTRKGVFDILISDILGVVFVAFILGGGFVAMYNIFFQLLGYISKVVW